jgi:hypothetical protein
MEHMSLFGLNWHEIAQVLINALVMYFAGKHGAQNGNGNGNGKPSG